MLKSALFVGSKVKEMLSIDDSLLRELYLCSVEEESNIKSDFIIHVWVYLRETLNSINKINQKKFRRQFWQVGRESRTWVINNWIRHYPNKYVHDTIHREKELISRKKLLCSKKSDVLGTKIDDSIFHISWAADVIIFYIFIDVSHLYIDLQCIYYLPLFHFFWIF
jgi:hypothetical protein